MDLFLIFAILLGGAAVVIWGVERLLDRSRPQRHTLAELEYIDVIPEPEGSVPGPFVGTTEWGALFVESGSSSVVIVLLPVIDAASASRIPDARDTQVDVDALITFHHPDGGHVWDDIVIDRFDVAPDRVLPAHRLSREPMIFDSIRVEPDDAGLRISWNDGEHAMCVGYELSLDALVDDPSLVRLAGSLAETQDATARGVSELTAQLQSVYLLGNVPPADAETSLFRAPIDELETFVIIDQPGDYDLGFDFATQWLFRQITDDNWDSLEEARGLVAEHCFTRLILEFILADRLEDAMRVADFGIAYIDESDFSFDRALLCLLRDQMTQAQDWFERSTRAAQPSPESWLGLAAIQLHRGDTDSARSASEAAVSEASDSPIVVELATRLVAAAGEPPRAREIFESHRDILETRLWTPLDRLIDQPQAIDPRSVALNLAELGDYAALRAIPMMDEASYDDAEGILRRALELDPHSMPAATELGRCLVEAGRFDEAMEVFDSAREHIAMGELVERDRGACLERVGRLDDAAHAYERCLDAAPEWHAARFDAIAVYAALAHRSRGEAHVDYLADHAELDERELADLRAQFEH